MRANSPGLLLMKIWITRSRAHKSHSPPHLLQASHLFFHLHFTSHDTFWFFAFVQKPRHLPLNVGLACVVFTGAGESMRHCTGKSGTLYPFFSELGNWKMHANKRCQAHYNLNTCQLSAQWQLSSMWTWMTGSRLHGKDLPRQLGHASQTFSHLHFASHGDFLFVKHQSWHLPRGLDLPFVVAGTTGSMWQIIKSEKLNASGQEINTTHNLNDLPTGFDLPFVVAGASKSAQQ